MAARVCRFDPFYFKLKPDFVVVFSSGGDRQTDRQTHARSVPQHTRSLEDKNSHAGLAGPCGEGKATEENLPPQRLAAVDTGSRPSRDTDITVR